MSKTFRDWSLDQALLLPPSVHDFVPAGHLSRFVVALVTEELNLSAILSYKGEKGQPPLPDRIPHRHKNRSGFLRTEEQQFLVHTRAIPHPYPFGSLR
jgi:hypothetical protein